MSVAANVIVAQGLSKRFYLRSNPTSSLKERFLGLFHERHRTEWQEFWALRNVSLSIAAGESVGLIGRNGSGKSTFLKLIAGIHGPTEGRVLMRRGARVGSMIELGVGFHDELTGRENVYLNASIFGLRRAEIDRMCESIVDFADIGPFIDQPIKNYSSGMSVRLGFAVAAHLDPDVLLLDEIFAVGDVDFQEKCKATMQRFVKEGKTILFVSHSSDVIRQMCGRLCVLSHGQVVFDGEVEDGLAAYDAVVASEQHPPIAQHWARPASVSGDLEHAQDYASPQVPAPVELPEWQYVPDGFLVRDPRITGWNVDSILQAQKTKWPIFQQVLQGPAPLGVAHEATVPANDDYGAHNTLMAYAYVLALAARKRDALSILDWGGGLGHYLAISRALLPDVRFTYYCKEVPLLCQGGRELWPDATFYDDEEECFRHCYDLVLVSGSFQYAEDWKRLLARLASTTGSYLYITRLPVVHRVPSFVVVQRPSPYGYLTEYLGWFLNRAELLKHGADLGLELVREFLILERPFVQDAPEQCEYRGFLFRPSANRG